MESIMNSRILAALIAASFFCTTGCGLFDSAASLPEPGKDLEVSAVVLLATGQVTADGNPLKAGTIIKAGQLLKTGANSFCDLQVRGGDGAAMIRLRANTELVLTGRQFKDKKKILAELRKGNGMFDLDKITSSENFETASPTAVASVRGTKYEVSVKGDSTSIEVLEGKVSSRPRVPALEDLPPDVQERSRVVHETVENLKKKEVILEPGKKVEIQAVKVSPEVEEAARKAMEAETASDPAKAEEAAKALDESVAQKEEGLKKAVQEAPAAQPEEIPEPEMKQKLDEYNELIRIESEKIQGDDVSSAVSERNNRNQAKLIQRIEKVFNKPSETLVLMNGARISGVVIQIGSTYYVHTVNGQVAYPESQVSGIEF
ncbi:MAG: hypothetical protein CMN77_02865 [Spirochaetaceae bacterium]|nr:hypothetical protein [Spirochaetaceae bacterium]|tara:strand:+ start:55882 stop:57006 length:1125 start_codon:yes stop_codon:yes gene_type:complete